MKNNISIKKVEKAIGFKFPKELERFYDDYFSADKNELIFKVSHLTNKWMFSNYHFWLLFIGDNDISNFDIYKSENTNKISIIKASEMIKDSLKENVLCFAWSHDCTEKDTGLFFKADGKIYGHSGNFSDECEAEFIADSLYDLFNIETDNRILKINEILSDNQWYYGDQECVDDIQDYERVIRDYFVNTSNGRLYLEKFDGLEIDSENRKLKLTLNQQECEFELLTRNGWIDTVIIEEMNKLLNRLNISRKQFVEIRDSSWGQELGIAFASKSQRDNLKRNGYIKE
ncbi:MAG: hypothetical protein B7Z06_11385 [Flavobacteriales bacterium 32-35-8]|nr:MAG: hypothetical protein B7Z06_11385 [Flavobacteriales bacterium 32-35-8]